MRAVVQRVSRAQVAVSGVVAGKIDRGLLVLLGVNDGPVTILLDSTKAF